MDITIIPLVENKCVDMTDINNCRVRAKNHIIIIIIKNVKIRVTLS